MTFNENHWSNTQIYVQFPYTEKVKKEKNLPKEQMTLIIMDTYKGQDRNTMFSNQWFSERVAAQHGSGKLPPDLNSCLI